MISFYCLKAYKEGGGVWKSPNLNVHTSWKVPKMILITVDHYCSASSSILKVLKVASFQYLYNFSKTKLGMKFIFCMQINIKLSTSCFWLKWADMSKLPKIRSKIFASLARLMQDIKKRVLYLLLWCKTFRYFLLLLVFIVILLLFVSLHNQTIEIVLPEHCNTIIKQQLCGVELPSLLPLVQVDIFL